MSHEIKCPHCSETFSLDDAGYAEIQNQVRTKEFEQALEQRAAELELRRQNDLRLAEVEANAKLQQAVNEKEREFAELKGKAEQQMALLKTELASFELQKEIALRDATGAIETERNNLASTLETERRLKVLELEQLRTSLEERMRSEVERKNDEIRMKDDAIDRLKDFKTKLSTKMVGESLEEHCKMEFDRIRPTAFNKNVYFEKDNDASSGTKGDFIYREFDDENVEIISIMFEMKNEQDTTATKKKNEDFFKKLDEDRTKKGCEYAVLVSLLESDNELYNSGIVDVSYRFPKMYVVRPQAFLTIITLLRNAAMNSLQFKTELAQVRAQNIDITNFENRLNEFKAGFTMNYDRASKHLITAVEGIDKTIKQLQKIRDGLVLSEDNLRLANEKAGDITVKKLTKGNPTMTEMFQQRPSDGQE
ncbi:MAG: hypothetical protein RIS63_1061 [Bacteroidota bacterium]